MKLASLKRGNMHSLSYDVLVIGAGPSGTCAASILNKKGLKVAIIERDNFPRFSIGESLLPQSMVYLEKAGLLEDLNKIGFQPKNGATFLSKGQFSNFDFKDKFTDGPYQTFQVQRATFDKTMADTCERNGVKIHYKHNVDEIQFNPSDVQVRATDLNTNEQKVFSGKFVLDASGFGRVLPRLLKLDRPSTFPIRRAIFKHMSTNFPDYFDNNKILITVDDDNPDVWLWTIPFSNNTCSIGVVGTEEYFKSFGDKSLDDILDSTINNSPKLKEIMTGSKPINEVRTIIGYSSNVSTLYGDRFALLGNAGEFLDPVFSSGVTIALHSASLAAELVARQIGGETIDWEREFSEPLKVGVETFKTYVKTWYTGELQTIIFYPKPEPRIKRMICSILAGYAWDQKNPYAADSAKAIDALARVCRSELGAP